MTSAHVVFSEKKKFKFIIIQVETQNVILKSSRFNILNIFYLIRRAEIQKQVSLIYRYHVSVEIYAYHAYIIINNALSYIHNRVNELLGTVSYFLTARF